MNLRSRARQGLLAFAAFLFCAFAAVAALAQNLQPIPALTAHVVDTTSTLDAIQAKGLEDKLMAFEQAKGTQIAVLIVGTTQPEDIASYANRVGNQWKIGRKGVGDGVLVVVAKDDRKIRIEVAKALEGAIPDLAASQIIDDTIKPAFRKNDYAGGLQAAADQLIARINGEALPEPPQRKEGQRTGAGALGFDWADLAIFLFIGVFVAGRVLRGILGRPLGSLATGVGVGFIAMMVTSSLIVAIIAAVIGLIVTLLSGFAPVLPRRGGWGGGPFIGGGGFGGGGGWGGGGGGGGWGGSGGGGDFGGGGASGDW